MRISQSNDKTNISIEAPEGAIIKPKGKKKEITPHIPTGYEIVCLNAECLKDHTLDLAGPAFDPKLSYFCDTANIQINWPSHKGQALIRKRIKGHWTEEHLKEISNDMFEKYASPANKRSRKKKQLMFESHVRDMKDVVPASVIEIPETKPIATIMKPKPKIKVDKRQYEAWKEMLE